MLNDFLRKMREITGQDSRLKDERDIWMLNPLVLAYIGDTIYDLFVRSLLIFRFDQSVHQLHMKAIHFVKAKAQSDTLHRILNQLTEEEKQIFRRGRNAKSGNIPKNADVGEYHTATGFEAVLGYLYLTGNDARLMEILKMTLDEHE